MFVKFILIAVNIRLQICGAVDLGDPLILTPLLEKGNYKEAQKESRVTPDIGNITSFSGFFTIDKTCESNLFFWFMPAQKSDWEKAPVLFWQQGGPGTTAFFGLFQEIGPFQHFNNSGLTKRQYSWNVENNLLIIDNPAGVGFSFSRKKCYPDNQVAVGEGLYLALVQFFQLFPQLRNNSFILSGQSYGGHYVPAYAHTIHKYNPTAEIKINLTGILLLSAWTDPISQIDFGTYYYQLGLIDDWQRDIFYSYQKQCVESITVQNWDYAFYNCNILTGTLYDTFMGLEVNIYNFLPETGLKDQNWDDLIQSDDIRKSFHVGNLSYQTFSEVIIETFKPDKYKSVKPFVQELIEYYPMVFVHGQLDLICSYPMAINFLRSLQWSGNTTYLNANRTQWCFDKETVGYYKEGGRLYDILVRGAGHYIPQDKPSLGYLIANSITSGFPGHPLHALEKCKTSATFP